MTEVLLVRDEGDLTVELCVKGHAGFAKAGRDIVCSAVSILTFSAAQVALEYREDGAEVTVGANNGDMRIYARFATKDAYERFLGQMDVVIAGYEMLAESYPRHVRLKNGNIR